MCLAAALAVLLVCLPAEARRVSRQNKRQAARVQFQKAQKMREALNGRPARERTRSSYNDAIQAYRLVYHQDPTSPYANQAAVAVADLMTEEGRVLKEDRYFGYAIDQYNFLRREYPGSRYRFDALFTIGQIQWQDLDQPQAAIQSFQEFLKLYPGNHLAEQARQAIADIQREAKQAKAAKGKKPKPEPEVAKQEEKEAPTSEEAAPAKPGGPLPLVTSIRHWSTPDYTRVAIDLEDEVPYQAGRIAEPDRIFFDLQNTKLASELVGKTFDVEDGFLKRIRVAQYQLGTTRVVLEVRDLAEYSAFLLPNPYRLIVDIHGKAPSDTTAAAKPKPAPETAKTEAPPAASKAEDARKSAAEEKKESESEKEAKTTSKPTTGPTYEAVAPREETVRKTQPSSSGREARPTASGEHSLVRALGLKIGRIVIDPGHGGHDTGTIGRGGYTEKELVLDVGLRLGKLLQSKMGADVVFTRDDDTFIPLESRTAVANQNQADLFLSIHANSSRDPGARGVETYYLNFTSSEDALEVAARENAVSEKSIHELQDLVKKIALKDKIEESREFASEVQTALYSGISKKNAGLRNRGVKKAPFVVLIGANMPSILAEISFLSNSADERKLRTPEYRQKIAEAIYKGVAKYVDGLSGISLASKSTRPEKDARQ